MDCSRPLRAASAALSTSCCMVQPHDWIADRPPVVPAKGRAPSSAPLAGCAVPHIFTDYLLRVSASLVLECTNSCKECYVPNYPSKVCFCLVCLCAGCMTPHSALLGNQCSPSFLFYGSGVVASSGLWHCPASESADESAETRAQQVCNTPPACRTAYKPIDVVTSSVFRSPALCF